MVQDLPNAPGSFTRTSSGYALAIDGKMALKSGLEHGGNAILTASTTGAGNSNDVTSDTVFAEALTSGGVVNVNVSSAQETEGRVLHVYDAENNAGSNTISINTSSNSDETAGDLTITSNSGQTSIIYNGTSWHTF